MQKALKLFVSRPTVANVCDTFAAQLREVKEYHTTVAFREAEIVLAAQERHDVAMEEVTQAAVAIENIEKLFGVK